MELLEGERKDVHTEEPSIIYTFCGSHKIYIIIDVMNINIKMQLGGLLVDDGHAWRKEKWRLRFMKGTYKITTKTLHIDICL